MGKMHVREATFEDLDFLIQLENSCFACHRKSDRRSLRTSLNSSSQKIYILEKIKNRYQSCSVGSATVIFYKHSLRIYSIAIHPESRSHGMGDFLLRYIMSVAQLHGFERVTLEADAHNEKLVAWYRKFSFDVTEQLPDYYAPGEPAVRMVNHFRDDLNNAIYTGNVVVVDQVKKWQFALPGVEIVSARDYLTKERFRNSERYHVLNLCNSYKTHSIGYYVSLIASARNHRIVPLVMAMKDVTNVAIAQSLMEEITDFVQLRLAEVSGNSFELPVILGKTPEVEFTDLAKKLFSLFEVPFFSVIFSRSGQWKLRQVKTFNLTTVVQSYPDVLHKAIDRYFQKKRHRRTQLKQYKYDLAILINPEDKTPPSCPEALEKFRKAAEQVGFFVEFIDKKDYRRLCEFDALFIRETTAIENHTYRFARHAYTEGLVVMDDPWSILRCSNKIYLYERLDRGRIRQPKSWLLSKHAMTRELVASLSFPLVLKLPESSFSLGVYRVANREDLAERLKTMFAHSDLVIAQEFLTSDYDWRIGVIDQKPLYACKYYMANGHWQIYNWQHEDPGERIGLSEPVPIAEVPPHIVKAAVKASSLIGDGLYGVDLKEVNGKAYVIEINDNPNIDADVEDILLKDELYLTIMRSFYQRIERERQQPRYLL
ncbi:MAG: GNAT family N-acetyltransferase [Desulfuromonadaceae bacterium]|nr:GNAT family N-acetyltransferase [Desulfuromonadaceae bacterium]